MIDSTCRFYCDPYDGFYEDDYFHDPDAEYLERCIDFTEEEIVSFLTKQHGLYQCLSCFHWNVERRPSYTPHKTTFFCVGKCQRYPPKSGELSDMGWAAADWPWTDWRDWCGEWQDDTGGKDEMIRKMKDS